MTKPTSDYEALVLALQLAITAPTEERAAECVSMAEDLAANLTELEVARAKKEAQEGAE